LWNHAAKICTSSSSIVRSGPTNSSSAAPISSSSACDDQSRSRRPTASSNRAACAARSPSARQQRLYLRPLPHGQALFLETGGPIRAHATERLGRPVKAAGQRRRMSVRPRPRLAAATAEARPHPITRSAAPRPPGRPDHPAPPAHASRSAPGDRIAVEVGERAAEPNLGPAASACSPGDGFFRRTTRRSESEKPSFPAAPPSRRRR
jgi:hypothetical protein